MRADVIAARRAQVGQLVLARYSSYAIAAEMDVPQSTIHRDIKALRAEWQVSRLDAIEQTTAEDLQRLAAVERAIWPAVLRGDLPAVTAWLHIQERRSKLLGLDREPLVDSEPFLRALARQMGEDEDAVVQEAEGIALVAWQRGRKGKERQ